MTVFSKCSSLKCTEVLHPWTNSCSYASLEIFYHIFRHSFKIYGTLYLITTILKGRSWNYIKGELPYEIIRSTTFLSINGSLLVTFLCLARRLLGVFTKATGGIIPAALASYSAILVERPERRGLLALYMFNNTAEVIFNALVQKNIIKTVPYGEIYMFCTATGILMYLYRKNELTNGFLRKVIRYFLGDESNGSSTRTNTETLILPTVNINYIYQRLLSPVKAFSIGYLLESLPRIFRSLLKPMKIPRLLLRKESFKLGLFLGSFVSIFQLVEFLMVMIRRKKDAFNSLMAGAASGLSMLFYRSSTISLYLFTKVAEILLKNAQNQGYIPIVPHVDVIMYTMATAITIHMCIYYKQSVRPSYWKFLSQITNGRIDHAIETFSTIF